MTTPGAGTGNELRGYERIYDEMWRGIVENDDGTLNLDQVKRELSDYAHVMEQVSEVYVHITDGRMSKPNYYARDVISQADDVTSDLIEAAVTEAEERGRREALEEAADAVLDDPPSVRVPLAAWLKTRAAGGIS